MLLIEVSFSELYVCEESLTADTKLNKYLLNVERSKPELQDLSIF
jgi:hypothetical protein